MAQNSTLYLTPLRPDQYEIAKHPAKIKAVCCGRRWGKSVMGGDLVVLTAYQGGRVAWVTPTYKNGRPLWRWVERTVSGVSGIQVNRSERVVTFPNGGFIAMYSGDSPDSIRGENFHLVVVDEAAKLSEDVYTDAIMPTVADNNGDILLLTTPAGKNWFYYEYLKASINGAAWQRPSSDNPNPNIRHAFDLARERSSERTFKQEWLAEFTEDGGGVFRNVRGCVYGEMDKNPPTGRDYVFGVDLGKHNDFTVIVVIDKQTRKLVYYEAFNQIDYTVQLNRLKALADRLKPSLIVIERNIGEMFIEQAQRLRLPVEAFQTNNASKQVAIDNLALAFEQNAISIPNDAKLIAELESYEMERLPGGTFRYSAPQGMHDDMVIATALAWHGVNAPKWFIGTW